MANIGYGLFDGSSSDYTVIPHSDIPKQEEWIKLSDNRISVVGDLEFSSYTALTKLDLNINEIYSIHPSAFNETIIVQLKLGNNKLTEFDFSAIGTTLTMLYLGLNSFTNFHSGLLQGLHNLQFLGLARLNVADWPNLTYFGSNKFDGTKTINLNYADVDTLSSKPIFTWCKIDVITMIDRKLSTIPTFHCPSHNETKIAHLKLSENYLSDFTSFD